MPREFEPKPKFGTKKKVQEGGVEKGAEKKGELSELTKREIFDHLSEQEEKIQFVFGTVGGEMSNEQTEKLKRVREQNKIAFEQLQNKNYGIELSKAIDLHSRDEDEARKSLAVYEERIKACKAKIGEYEEKRSRWKGELGFSEGKERKEK